MMKSAFVDFKLPNIIYIGIDAGDFRSVQLLMVAYVEEISL